MAAGVSVSEDVRFVPTRGFTVCARALRDDILKGNNRSKLLVVFKDAVYGDKGPYLRNDKQVDTLTPRALENMTVKDGVVSMEGMPEDVLALVQAAWTEAHPPKEPTFVEWCGSWVSPPPVLTREKVLTDEFLEALIKKLNPDLSQLEKDLVPHSTSRVNDYDQTRFETMVIHRYLGEHPLFGSITSPLFREEIKSLLRGEKKVPKATVEVSELQKHIASKDVDAFLNTNFPSLDPLLRSKLAIILPEIGVRLTNECIDKLDLVDKELSTRIIERLEKMLDEGEKKFVADTSGYDLRDMLNNATTICREFHGKLNFESFHNKFFQAIHEELQCMNSEK